MFRGCYFEYAGKSSEPFNLMLYYLDNDNMKFDSGGSFELKTDKIPYTYEQFLYGKDYSEKPLEFEVEIVTPEGNIPYTKMIEIKNWLFGQEAWKELTLIDETQLYHLKCLLIPSEDITDCNGYRGVRCTIKNASPFWYGEEKSITINTNQIIQHNILDSKTNWWGWCVFEINIPNDDCVNCDIFPEIVVDICRDTKNIYSALQSLQLTNTNAKTVSEGIEIIDKDFKEIETSRISCDLKYMDGDTSQGYEEFKDKLTISTKYITFKSEKHSDKNITPLINEEIPVPCFKLHYGTNICRIFYGWGYKSITFKYTPMYRMGAF